MKKSHNYLSDTERDLTAPILIAVLVGAVCFALWPAVTALVGGVLFWLGLAGIGWAAWREGRKKR